MITSWSLPLLTVMTGSLLIAPITADTDMLPDSDAQQLDGPVISPSVSEIILQSGQNYTLYCTGKRPIKFKQQEISEEVSGPFYMEQYNITSDIQYEYKAALDLYFVDRFAVGYYACFDDTVDGDTVLTSEISEEPNNTAHITYIYIYVNGSNMFAPLKAFVVAKSNSKYVIECRPTSPDIKVTLSTMLEDIEYDQYNPKVGFVFDSDALSAGLNNLFICGFERRGQIEHKDCLVFKAFPPPEPTISGGIKYFLKGENFSINCTARMQRNVPVALTWMIPGSLSKVTNVSNEYEVNVPILFINYTIQNASKEDEGVYSCTSRNGYEYKIKNFTKVYLDEPFILMNKSNNVNPIVISDSKLFRSKVTISAYPAVDVDFLRNNNVIRNGSNKFIIKTRSDPTSGTIDYIFTIRGLVVEDTANYTIMAKNQYMSNETTFDLRVQGPPKVDFPLNANKKYLQNTQASLQCKVVGYPIPQIDWIFSNEDINQVIDKQNQIDTVHSLYEATSVLTLKVLISGNVTCRASNQNGSDEITRKFLVYEVQDGFGIEKTKTWYSENQDVELKCLASKYDFVNVTWYGLDDIEMDTVSYTESSFSYIAKLYLNHISVDESGNYRCVGVRIDGSEESETISITVAETRLPEIVEPMDVTIEVLPYHDVNFTCTADAVPPPRVEWYKNGEPLELDTNLEITNYNSNHSTINSIIKITKMQEENVGEYKCDVISQSAKLSKTYKLIYKEKATFKVTYLSVIGVVFFLLIILVAYLVWKIRKEKQFRKELAAAGLLNFKKGVTKSINPDLGIDEQAELLPYDEKFEFPADKLILGKQLGAGAFGVVYKAEARGIINAEETTTVAVKMVKKTADNMYIKALASELKIMVHLGKHINIVNLLGACTKNVGKRELIVIVEYCKYGNIHNYMQKHREVFIDQLTDNPEKNLGKINRGYSCSSGNSGMHSDYFGSNHTQETDHTFLNTANTNRSGRKVSESGYVQPEWRSNYESDYSFDGRSPRPLCSRDLLAWAFQIARGMEYLASRKVLHGDLAARNVLLADDNIVKICDFGLARSIYKNDEYQKQENSPLPVKWLAIECMTDRIFSTQSDVWSFGIVLWELFSLAKTPYPNVSPPSLLLWLSDGHRLEKPPYADDRLYDVMMRCWEQKPTARPSFSELQLILGSFLEDNVRNHYVDLNAAYMDMNVKRDGEEDYLAMVSAPDYNNLVTPSPHHYVNDARSFFPSTPTQLQHDDEGYLQMSPATRQTIFNARAQGTKFDFDARKLTPRVSEANSYGSELTPMLTLNNLPRSGSESDHEGNASPYLNMCPRIEEETDEVFETKQNNAKNLQPDAVTNPTYITFSTDDEKKSQNFTNNYINVNVPNGLVK